MLNVEKIIQLAQGRRRAQARPSHSESRALAIPSIRQVPSRLSSYLTGKPRQLLPTGRGRACGGQGPLPDKVDSS